MMFDFLKLGIVFVVILLLLKRKWNIGYVMFVVSMFLYLMYLTPPKIIISTAVATVKDSVTIKLFFSLTLIRVLELILREEGILTAMTEATRRLLSKGRAGTSGFRIKSTIVSMPLLIGLLPSLGGAYFSAPMVDESTKNINMSPEEKAFINYWFRHPWEYILPLYPGILLASALTSTDLRDLILANTAYALMIILTGFSFSMKNIKQRFMATERGDGPVENSKIKQLVSFLPLLFILFLVIVVHIELHYSLLITITALFIFYRKGIQYILKLLKYGFEKNVIVLILGTMFFKFSMESSGAVNHLNRFFLDTGIPLLPIMFLLPFISGILTGLVIGFVGSTFPLLMSIGGELSLWDISFAFASGYAGVLLSPVHLCFVLTKDYFSADLGGMYRRILPSVLLILSIVFIQYFVMS